MNRHRRVWLAAAAAVLSASMMYLVSCYDFEYGGPGGPDGSLPEDSGSDVRVDTGPQDAGDSGTVPGRCDSNRGPRMLEVPALQDAGTFCIDTTEVTRAQYAEFMAAHPTPTGFQQIADCAWNTSFNPNIAGAAWPDAGPNTASNPVTGVDWCDAYAFCKWAEKSLCGDTRGGPHSGQNEPSDRTTDRWRIACTHGEDGQHAYPYGNAFRRKACNDKVDGGDEQLKPVASMPGCEGGYPGLFDMSGNAIEWEDSCGRTTGDGGRPKDPCKARGGSMHHDVPDYLLCNNPFNLDRDYRMKDVGFRCCK